ncbi:Host specificity protein J of prophage [Escherichia coli]|uniref:phage attachment tail tip protein J n=1 Tax=Escherichia coli TaxID=562 RepID=UPI000DA53B84|nr:phage tail protein [Escherichia coli]SRB77496.1 Host specificity protein J of prophage [Escherichia coli]
MGKGSSKGHTPREAKGNLKSTQLLSVIDAISEGPVEGPVDGLKSVLLNSTPVLDSEGNTNISGVTVVFRAGEQEQTPPEGFESSGSETVLGTEVKYDTPITRTITSANIDRLRFTFGVQALVETTSKGDRNPSEVRLLVQIQRNGGWVTEKDITIKGKTTSQYLASVVVDNLPPRPFNIRMRRMTPDSTTDQLQNKTLWSSYTEIIDVKQCYPNTALVGVQVDSEQFGSQQVSRNYHLRGRILQVPSNYNPQTRQYSGIWDGTFKPAYSNNMAWCLWDMLTHPRYGMGKRLGAADVDKWALYVIGQYCDQSVPDGFGGTEPRITCNAYLTTQRKAWDVLSDFCSAMRCMPVWNGQTLTFVQDRPSDKVWTYNRSNVVMPDDGAPFRYSFSALKDRGGWVTEKDITIKGKTTSQYLASVVVDNLPPRPFNIRMRRMTPDSTTDQLQNKTLWSSYTEIIDVKQCYPNTALVGVQVDSEQFGSQQVSRNYHLRGRILQVPSNYNPQTRQYSGIWDGTFKPAYSNNMAWCLWDMLTHPRYGMGKRLGAADVDKWALYVIGQYCDQSVPDGFGGTEPRITCNAYLTTQRKAWDVLSDFCSAMRCMPVWNGQTLTFVQDRPSDKVWTYNRSNVVMPDDGAPFRYSFSALKDRHNAVEVNWIDPDNGWETATELVEDTQAIVRYGRNVTKMDAFGCTSRGQAHRAGLWLIKTELLETQTVDFSVGAEGLRHVPGDVIEICDDDYAGISTGGRVLAVNSQTRTLTLDREITLTSSGTTLISLVDGQGSPVSVEVQSVTDGVKVKVSRVPDGVAEYSVWGLKLPTLRQRLFRCVSIRENDDGMYAITAVQHVPEKEAIVDNGAHFDGNQSGTVNGVTPPAVQHLTAEVTADSGEYQVLARWDTPKVVKGVSFLLRLTVAADDGSERLVSTARTKETTYRFTQLALGNYRLTVRAVNAWGQQGDPASVSFRIAAPAAPSRIELTPGYFQITATPHLAVYDSTVLFEFWFSEKRIADIRQVETSASYLGTALYWIVASINIKPGHDYYFYVRSVNTIGKSAFVEAVGRASDDAEGYLDFFKGEIGKTHLAQELWTQIDNGQLAPDLAEIRTSITNVSNEITQTVNKKLENQSAAIQQIQKVQVDTNNNLNSMWAVKLQQMKDGRLYIAGIGAGIENTPAGMQSQVLLAADRIAMINPANGNTKPMFVGQGDQIFMNDVFLKRLTAPTITSGGNPPAFSLTPDGRLTAKNADISGNVNANSGTLNNVTINENCRVLGKLSANQIEGDLVKTVGKAFPRDSRAPERWPSGTITVRVYDDQPFDRQIVIPAVAFSGAKHEREHTDIYSSCRLIVRKNGAEIYNRTALDNTLIYSGVIDMPAGHGHMTLEFSVSAWLVNDWYPTASISDLLVVVMKKATAGISIS